MFGKCDNSCKLNRQLLCMHNNRYYVFNRHFYRPLNGNGFLSVKLSVLEILSLRRFPNGHGDSSGSLEELFRCVECALRETTEKRIVIDIFLWLVECIIQQNVKILTSRSRCTCWSRSAITWACITHTACWIEENEMVKCYEFCT